MKYIAITKDIAFEGVNNYCHKEYDWSVAKDNPIGLHMEFYEDGDYIVSTWHPEHNYQGWVDTMHGGILSTLIDEVCGWVVTRKLQTNLLIACSMMIIQMLSSEYRKN